MSNPISDFMAWLGGADPELLARVEHERPRFTQMAGVLLTTASIATLSMFFALRNGVKIPLAPAILLGAGWGLVILNLDRFLVLSMAGVHKAWRLALVALPRLLLASVLALVISTPLVLRIFASDIKEQLHVIELRNSAQQGKLEGHTQEQRQLDQVNKDIARDDSILDGDVPPASSPALRSAANQVASLTSKTSKAQTAMNNAFTKWKCEESGQTGAGCGGVSGKAGNGPRSQADHLVYEQDRQAYDRLKSQLAQATAAEQSAQRAANANGKAALAQDQAQARQDLKGKIQERKRLQAEISSRSAAGTRVNEANTGLLAQLQALSEASAKNSSLNAARLAVLALFFLIEILPVTVKILLNLGQPSAYDKVFEERTAETTGHLPGDKRDRWQIDEARRAIIRDESMTKVKRAGIISQERVDDVQSEARVRNHMRQRREDLGYKANDYVADEMERVLKEELTRWSGQVRDMMSGNRGASGNGGGPGPGASANGSGANGSGWQTRRDPGYDLPGEDRL